MDVDEDSSSDESEEEPQKKKVRELFCRSHALEYFLILTSVFFLKF